MFRFDAASLVREIRSRAGLSQRELAERAGTTQSVIARIEVGDTRPRTDTVKRLAEAAGFALHLAVERSVVSDPHMLDDVERILRLTPEERLREVANVSGFVADARRT